MDNTDIELDKTNQDEVSKKLVGFNLYSDLSARKLRFPSIKTLFTIMTWFFAIITLGVIGLSVVFYHFMINSFFDNVYLAELGDFVRSFDSNMSICGQLDTSYEINQDLLNCVIKTYQDDPESIIIDVSKKEPLNTVINALHKINGDAFHFNITKSSDYLLVIGGLYDIDHSFIMSQFGDYFDTSPADGDKFAKLIGTFFESLLPGALIFYCSGFLTIVLIMFSFRVFADKTPETLLRLWKREIIQLPKSETKEGKDDSETKFLLFIGKFQKRMNHWAQLIFCLGGAGLMMWRVIRTQNLWPEGLLKFPTNPFFYFEIISQPLIGIILGAIFWRLLITSYLFHKLAEDYELSPRIEHPDKLGGMAILGNLFLWNTLIFVLPSIFFSAWYVILKNYDLTPLNILPYYEDYVQARIEIFSFFLIAGIILVILAFISFILPLYKVHIAMLKSRSKLEDQLDNLSNQIHKLKNDLLGGIETISTEDRTGKLAQIELLQKSELQVQRIPTWPYDTSTIVKFIIAQSGPILTLMGVSNSIIKIVGNVIEKISQ